MAGSDRDNSEVTLKQQWNIVLANQHEFAGELEKISGTLSGKARRHVKSLSQWFKGPAEFEDAIKRPDVLAVCLPLMKLAPDEDSPNFVSQAARQGFCALSQLIFVTRNVAKLLIYPLLVLFAGAALWIGFSIWIAPHFDELYAEFGIELPALTLAVLELARWVRDLWWVLLAVPVGIAAIWMLNHVTRHRRPYNLSWIDQRLMSTRNALASFAWHVSMLLDIGQQPNDALRTAGSATGNAWLKRICLSAVDHQATEQHALAQPFLLNPKYRLLDHAMRLPPSSGKIALLRQVATYYWDRNRNVGDWWVHLLVGLIMCIIGAAIVVCVFSLFMPLIAIVSGLTGMKG